VKRRQEKKRKRRMILIETPTANYKAMDQACLYDRHFCIIEEQDSKEERG